MKVGFVIQRYGTEILGGAEYCCRLLAERLAPRHHIEVLTTCARDYITWANEYPEGADRVRGVNIRRFPTSRTRDIQEFNRYSDWIFNNPHTRQDEMEWLRQQGPWSPALQEYIEKHASQYDVLVFFTYLYAPSVLGLKADPSRSILVPTAHDEPAIHLEIFKEVFSLPAGLAYLTEAERRFVRRTFELRAVTEEIAGCGVDMPGSRDQIAPDTDTTSGETYSAGPEPLAPHLRQRGAFFRRRHRIDGPFVLYGGRIDPGKGCEELFEYFATYAAEAEAAGADPATLFLMGTKLMPIPEEPWVRFAGTLSDQERAQALEAATIVVVPSPYESLSLLTLEAFAVGTPVLGNARSEVVTEHCRRSNAGLYYGDRDEFVESLKVLLADERLRRALGRNGREYIRRHYRWDVIIATYERMFQAVREPAAPARRR